MFIKHHITAFPGVISTIGKFPKINQLRMILSVSIFPFLEGKILLTTLPFFKMEKGEKFIKKEKMENGKLIYIEREPPKVGPLHVTHPHHNNIFYVSRNL
jgi:hypothetical protein